MESINNIGINKCWVHLLKRRQCGFLGMNISFVETGDIDRLLKSSELVGSHSKAFNSRSGLLASSRAELETASGFALIRYPTLVRMKQPHMVEGVGCCSPGNV